MKSKGIFLSVLVVSMLFAGCKKEENIIPDPGNDTSQGSEIPDGEMLETELDEKNVGEGAPDSVPMDVKDSESYQVGDVITISSGEKNLYELTIDEIAFTDQRDEYTQDPGNVILVTYTYKNLSEEALLIDDMRFQLMDEGKVTLYDSYYLADAMEPEMIGAGESCTAQIAYSAEEKPDKVVLAYKDTVHSEVAPIKIEDNNLE